MFNLPQRDLDQIPGTPFFHTPNTPADPQDCDRYPNSPWCGESPIGEKFVDFNVEIVKDDCYIGIEVTPSLGFIALPSFQLLYRNPNCTPPVPVDFKYGDSPYIPPQQGSGIYIWICEGDYFDDYHFNNGENSSLSESSWNYEYISAQYPNGDNYPDYRQGRINIFSNTFHKFDLDYQEGDENGTSSEEYVSLLFEKRGGDYLYYIANTADLGGAYSQTPTILVTFNYRHTVMTSRLPIGKNISTYSFKPSDIYGNSRKTSFNRTWKVFELNTQPPRFVPPPPPPPPPTPPTPPEDDMGCCADNERLLKLILARIGNLPAQVPKSYLTKNGNQPKELKSIASLTELIGWQSERLDEVLGESEIAIQIEDTDLAKEGNQSQTIRLPNLAEAIAEMFTLLIQTNINNELLINMATRTLIETGQVKQSEFKTYSALLALIEYMGFPTKQTSEKMPLSFTPGAIKFDQFLKETEQEVGIIDYDDKVTLTSIMQSLLQGAAIIRAVYFRPLSNDKQTAKAQLIGDLSKMVGNTDNIKKQIEDYIKDIEEKSDGYLS